nr:alpha/beta hydrolase [Ciceribacter ferrooxidans]
MRSGFIGLLAVCLVAAGCAGRPVGVMEPVDARADGASRVDLIAATTRAPSEDKAILFTGERGSGLMMDAVTISIPPEKNRKVGQVQWPKRLPPDPSREFATAAVDPLDSDAEAKVWLGKHKVTSRRVLVFVHGFNNLYEDSVYRFAQIVHDSGAEVVPVVFTWPSRGNIFDYAYDRESTNYSRDALEDLLTRIASHPDVSDVTVMAHSMGTWLAVESLRQMAIRNGRVHPKINNVILAAPDLDVDVFAQQFRALQKDAPHFTLFVSRDDRALTLSKHLSGNVERLGRIDPSKEPYRSELESAGITVIDLTELKAEDQLNHGKFAESPEVVRLIGQRLVAGQTITDSQVGLGEGLAAVTVGATSTVGQAAGAVISAPISIFDPRTRRSYGRQLILFGQSAEGTIGSVGNSLGATAAK